MSTKEMKRWRNLCQVAMSVTDMDETVAFYEELGYKLAGGTDHLRGWVVSKIQDYKGARGRLRWMNDGSPGFQLELFRYENPPARAMARDARPCDIGYSRMGIWVADFDAVLVRLKARGTHFVSEPRTYEGGRRACIRDPNGVYLELMEEDVRNHQTAQSRASANGSPVRSRTLTLSVPCLEQAESYFEGLLGMERMDGRLHTSDMEGMWGLEGAKTRTTLLRCDDFLLELVEYLSPRGKARPSDEQIGDAGIWHFALWFRKGRYVKQAYRETCRAGHSSYSTPLNMGLVSVVYIKTDQGFTVEYFYAPRLGARFFGFHS